MSTQRFVNHLAIVSLLSMACASTDREPQTAMDTYEEDRILGENMGDGSFAQCTRSMADVHGHEASCESKENERRKLDCAITATMYWRGCGVPKDHRKAEELYAQACRLGSTPSCSMQALLVAGRDPAAVPQVVAIFESSCERGDVHACGNLGVVLTTRVPSADRKQVARGLALLEEACDRYGNHCVAYARVVSERRLQEHYAEATHLLKSSCDKRHLESCNQLAQHYEQGSLGILDQSLAADLASRACDRGHLPACYTVGLMLAEGHGFGRDEARAAMMLYDLCTKRVADSCFSVAWMVEKGRGVKPDARKAMELHRYGCKLGSKESCESLASGAREHPDPGERSPRLDE